MRLYRTLEEAGCQAIRDRGLALGVFDGVHQGHTKILDALKGAVLAQGLDSAMAVTMHPHPLAVLRPERAPKMILSLGERLQELRRHGLDEVLVLEFTASLAATAYESFTRDILQGILGMRLLVAGYDFHLGRNREGSAENMAALGERLGFRVQVVTPCYLDDGIISSTRIRSDLTAGRIEAASRALGHPYVLSGRIVPGQGKGRLLGFPTANLAPFPEEKVLPPAGVYLVRSHLEGAHFAGLMNLGWAPTLRNSFQAEVHLLDFAGDLVDHEMEFAVIKRLRSERRFPDAAALALQIREDVAQARKILATDLLRGE